ncbi:MAG: hypothetical protein QG564_1665 [Campylobacterota bacterium]|nr:hypothetical protein [Campylobacterota bacterium]
MKKITLDARELEHPKPLAMAINILKNLEDADYLYMIHRKNPVPLIDLAQEHHFQVLSREDAEGTWHILITKNHSVDLKEYLFV